MLLSILKNRSIWLGSSHNLNDYNEGELLQHLLSYAEAQGVEKAKTDAIKDKLTTLDCYVNCMTSKRDMLSQWRGYGANGAGVAIGFKSDVLLKAIAGNPVTLLRQVTYADSHTELTQTAGLWLRHC